MNCIYILILIELALWLVFFSIKKFPFFKTILSGLWGGGLLFILPFYAVEKAGELNPVIFSIIMLLFSVILSMIPKQELFCGAFAFLSVVLPVKGYVSAIFLGMGIYSASFAVLGDNAESISVASGILGYIFTLVLYYFIIQPDFLVNFISHTSNL